mmetsp:Transcript_27249/g.31096  ORF Transcript_27249/g.31096 Transcript_27249/m.31096 type:complete len:107 (-) Transcript_27249:164-484(-)
MESPTPQPARPRGNSSDDARDARLRFRNFAQHQIRQDFKEEAQKKCSTEIRNFAQCAKEKGLMVIFSCRSYNRAITECMFRYNSDEAFAKYLKDNPQLLPEKNINH